jgi:hypothetical protein
MTVAHGIQTEHLGQHQHMVATGLLSVSVLLFERDEEEIRAAYAAFRTKWGISHPLHSAEIRGRTKNFSWLKMAPADLRDSFYSELNEFLLALPVIGHACVIDRPGYNKRYLELHGRNRWLLCKTAFAVVVERAAKFAQENGCRLRVFVERGDKVTDRCVKGYYDELKQAGAPFGATNSGKYQPMSAADFTAVLYEFRAKAKSSPPMQIADMYLWPICIGGYDPMNRPYQELVRRGKLIDAKFAAGDVPARGIKYSCWELAGAVGTST